MSVLKEDCTWGKAYGIQPKGFIIGWYTVSIGIPVLSSGSREPTLEIPKCPAIPRTPTRLKRRPPMASGYTFYSGIWVYTVTP
jgi:hypothetical protein